MSSRRSIHHNRPFWVGFFHGYYYFS
jgi:hypothetical protein